MNSAPEPIRLRAPAKVNLGLRLVGQRPDGYHLLESVFAPLELADEVEVGCRGAFRPLPPAAAEAFVLEHLEMEVVTSPGSALPEALADVPSGPENLCARAAAVYCAAVGWAAPLRIRLKKAVPAGAGLGGGSSDAAAVLRGLAQLLESDSAAKPTGARGLAEIGLGLGADIPFFLSPQLAHVSGVGEQIERLEPLPETWLVLANPGISLATAEVYRSYDECDDALTDSGAGSTMRAFSRLRDAVRDPGETTVPSALIRSDARPLWQALLVNDLAPAASRLCPAVGRLLEAIESMPARDEVRRSLGASLSGSGATVLGVMRSREAAEEAARDLEKNEPDCAWTCATRLV